MNTYLKQLAQNDLNNAQDNLYRARLAAKNCDAGQIWGESGKTLLEIIKGYEAWETRALEALREVSK